jgi:hypothetical protein
MDQKDYYKAEMYLSKTLAPEVIIKIRDHLEALDFDPCPERILEAVTSLMVILGGVVADATASYFCKDNDQDQKKLRINLSTYILDTLEMAWTEQPTEAENVEEQIEKSPNVIRFPRGDN